MTYERVNWQNEPSENTPLSAENLNKMDSAIKELSEMVVANPVEASTDELKKVEIEGTVYKIAGGHELVNASGSTMTQRSKMSFPDSHLTDDSGNNQTIVDIVKEVTTAQWNNATEEGLYYINDKPDSIITAEQVAYGNGNVGSALDNNTPQKVTNTNGTAYKFPSGLMICTKTISQSVAVTSAWGSLYESSAITIGSWAEEFISTPKLSIQSEGSDSSCWIGNITDTTKSVGGSFRVIRPTSVTLNLVAEVIAIGTWK